MADPKGAKAAKPVDGAEVDARNTIAMAMEDLTEDDRKELEKELEEEMTERRCRKLACFLKTCHDIVKKVDTVAASSTKVSLPLSPKDLVHLVDVFVANKYGADLTQFTWVMTEDMHSTFDSLKQGLNASLPK
jgi:hypothetical protein